MSNFCVGKRILSKNEIIKAESLNLLCFLYICIVSLKFYYYNIAQDFIHIAFGAAALQHGGLFCGLFGGREAYHQLWG